MCFTLGIKTTKMSTVGVAIRPQQTEMSFKTMSSLNKIYAVIQPTHTKKQEIAPQEKSRPLNSEQKIENINWKLYRAAKGDKTAKTPSYLAWILQN